MSRLLSRDSCCCLSWCALRIEHDELDRRSIAGGLWGGARPAFRVRASRALVELVTTRGDVVLATVTPLVGRHVSNPAVTMLAVVPADKACDPALRRRDVCEREAQIRWRVLEGLSTACGTVHVE